MGSTPELDATVTEAGDLVVPAASLREVITASPGDHLTVHVLPPSRERTNMYGAFSEQPINLDIDDLADVRREMWASFGADGDA